MHGVVRTLALVLALAVVAPPPSAAFDQVCGGGRYTANSTFAASLQQVAKTLPTNASTSPLHFATAAVAGELYALALCRGDLSADTCNLYVGMAFGDAQQVCPEDTDVAMYYDACHIRFSGEDFLAAMNNSKVVVTSSVSQKLGAAVAGRFYRVVADLLNATVDYAVANSTTRFATGDVGVVGGQFDDDDSFSKIYALAQCTPDMTPAQCRACLAPAMAEMTRQVFPTNSRGGRVVGERCGLRFEVFSFYGGDAMVHLQLQVGQPQGDQFVFLLYLPCVSLDRQSYYFYPPWPTPVFKEWQLLFLSIIF